MMQFRSSFHVQNVQQFTIVHRGVPNRIGLLSISISVREDKVFCKLKSRELNSQHHLLSMEYSLIMLKMIRDVSEFESIKVM